MGLRSLGVSSSQWLLLTRVFIPLMPLNWGLGPELLPLHLPPPCPSAQVSCSGLDPPPPRPLPLPPLLHLALAVLGTTPGQTFLSPCCQDLHRPVQLALLHTPKCDRMGLPRGSVRCIGPWRWAWWQPPR